MFPTEVSGYGSKSKYMSFCTGTYKIHTRKQTKSRKKLSDKIKKKTIIVSTKAAYLSYHLPTPYLHSPLVCLLCVYSEINIIISYTKENQERRGNPSLVNATTYHSHL